MFACAIYSDCNEAVIRSAKEDNVILFEVNKNSRAPYQHQKAAMKALDSIDQREDYSTLIVLPTGGGKTYTASTWLLKNALDKKEKILWIAHRQFLLDQAAESFKSFAYAERIPHLTSFTYRIVSGSTSHDRAIDINKDDSLLLVGKDSLARNLDRIDQWLSGEETVFLVIDEAHHATAKTYRTIIEYVKARVPHVKLIGLTATPFRTMSSERGLLKKLFTDDIGYQISLKELINRGILSKPILESYETNADFGEGLGIDDWESITRLDTLPEEVASIIAKNSVRNHLIVDVYKKNKETYGKTIVFAVNITHAIALAGLFKKNGIKADYIVSGVKDMVTGVTLSAADNERKLEQYRDGDLDVLINVNILTEGVDIPQTKTVFLARPTVSTIMMTQMVGRALRGEKAGGTAEAYIVSFIDKISKIEEFANLLDSSIDTTKLEAVEFTKRIPIGMYAFTYLEQNGMDISHQVMVYDSTKEAYEEMMNSLPELFNSYGTKDEYLDPDVLNQLERQCCDTFFLGEMVPPYDSRDIKNILKYYALKDSAPQFYTFDDIDRNKLDISKIARHIYDEDMGERSKMAYLNQLWNDTDDNMLRLFFGRQLYFFNQVNTELLKLSDPAIYKTENNVVYGKRDKEKMSLSELRNVDPELEKKLREETFAKAKDRRGFYKCAQCGKRYHNKVIFQVDHIKPLNKGGLTVPENLQILCRSCNMKKGDKWSG